MDTECGAKRRVARSRYSRLGPAFGFQTQLSSLVQNSTFLFRTLHRVEISSLLSEDSASGRNLPLLSEQRRRFRDDLRHSPPRRNQHHDPREKNPYLFRGSSRFSHVPPSNDVKRSEERRVGKESRSRWSPHH